MKKFLLGLLVSLLPMALRADVDTYGVLYDFACKETSVYYPNIDCSELQRPVIVPYAPQGYYGLYFEDMPFIMVWSLRDYATVVHETTHYIIDHRTDEDDDCFNEEIAYRVEAAYTRIPYTEKWRELYEGCEL